jgi:mxaL protein
MRNALRDPRTWLLGAALALAISALFVPPMELERRTYDLVAFVDVTGSMNTRDMTVDGKAVSRLEAAKDALRELLVTLPCGSRLGLGVFTERRSFLFFDPIDTCADFAVIDDAVAALDWRMAWEGDSYIWKGLFSAVSIAESLKADLIFLTDGHEAPPLPASGIDAFEGKPGAVRGLIVGVGGRTPVAIPKFDDSGREAGVYSAQDVPQENHSGPPPADAYKRPGWHPRNAPFGSGAGSGTEHLTSVHDDHLKHLASVTGLSYAALIDSPNLLAPIQASARSRPVQVMTDARPIPASIALALLGIVYAGLPLFARWRGRRSRAAERRAASRQTAAGAAPASTTFTNLERKSAA